MRYSTYRLVLIAAVLAGGLAMLSDAEAYTEFTHLDGTGPDDYVSHQVEQEALTRFAMPSDEWNPLRIVRFYAGKATTPPDSFQIVVRKAVWSSSDQYHKPGGEILTRTTLEYPTPNCSDCGREWTRGEGRICVSITPGDTFFVGMKWLSSNVDLGRQSCTSDTTCFYGTPGQWTRLDNYHFMIEAVACLQGDANEDDEVTGADSTAIYNKLSNGNAVFPDPDSLSDYAKDTIGDGVIDSADVALVRDILDGKQLTLFSVRKPLLLNTKWDDDRKNGIKYRAGARQTGAAASPNAEDSVLAWCDDGSGMEYILYRAQGWLWGGDSLYVLKQVPDTLKPFTLAQVDTIVSTAVDSVDDDYWDSIWGWLVWHEAYRAKNGQSPSIWQRTHAMVDSLLAEDEFDGKYILATGRAEPCDTCKGGFTTASRASMTDTFFVDKNRCLWGEQMYAWRYPGSESQAVRDRNAVTELLDYAREACKWAGKDTLKWFAYVQTHKSSTNPTGAKYRYVSKPEIMWTSLCAIAHGAMGVSYYLFDSYTGGTQTDWGMWDTDGGTNPDSSETMLCGVREAKERLDEVVRCLDGYSYKYSTGDPGYAYNVASDTTWTKFGTQQPGGKGWLIKWVKSDEDSTDITTWAEVCRWRKGLGDECYVIQPRDTKSDHTYTIEFNIDKDCDINGYYQGRGREVTLTIPKGDCVVLRLY